MDIVRTKLAFFIYVCIKVGDTIKEEYFNSMEFKLSEFLHFCLIYIANFDLIKKKSCSNLL